MAAPDHALDVNTQVRDWVAALERAVDDPSLIVDQRLLERCIALNNRIAKLHSEGPRRLKQAPSARARRPAAKGGAASKKSKPA